MRLSPFFLLCGTGLFAIFSTTASKSPVLPLFTAHLGGSPAEVGLVAAVSPLAGILFSIPAGVLSDRFGRRAMLLGSAVVFASAPFLYLFAGGILQLAAIRLYHGVATAIFVPVAMAYVSELHEESKGEKLGWFSSATLLGRFMAPVAGGGILALWAAEPDQGFTLVYLLCAAAGIVALLGSVRLPKPRGRGSPSAGWQETLAGLKALASSPALLLTGGVEAAMLYAYGTLEVFLPLYALSLGLGAFEVGLFLSAQVITLAVTKPVMGRYSDRHGRAPQILCGALSGALFMAGLPLCTGFWGLLATSVLFGLSLSVVTSASSAAVGDLSRSGQRGSAMGIFGTVMDVGHSSGPLVSGIVAGWLGFRAAFWGAAIVLAAAALVYWAALGDRREQGSRIEGCKEHGRA